MCFQKKKSLILRLVNGARTVVEAVAHSKLVAESMHQYMQELAAREKG